MTPGPPTGIVLGGDVGTPAALVDLMGGPEVFANRLDSLFKLEQESGELPEWISGYIGQYVRGNEPSHYTPLIRHGDIMAAGELVFVMSPMPSTAAAISRLG